MKIQCACGAKYAFDVTPEMAQNPVRFECPSCGLDSSELVNRLVREELAAAAAVSKTDSNPLPAAASRLKISREEKPAEPPLAAAPVSKYCARHRGELVTEHCVVCRKPICPKCLVEFGYFCSPLCKGKAEAQKIVAPIFAGQKFEVERRFWCQTGRIFGALAAATVLFLGAWIWYAWFGSVPHTYFSVRFDDDSRAYAGAAQLVGPDQIIFLHGGTLARYDLKMKKQIWSQELIAPRQVAEIVQTENDRRARENAAGEFPTIPPAGSQERAAKIILQRALSLHVAGQNVWVGQGEKLVHYGWEDGKILQTITLPEMADGLVERNGELEIPGGQSVTRINLADGATRVEDFSAADVTALAASSNAGAENPASGGLLAANGQPLDPDKVTAQAQNLKLPARLALPALLANDAHEQQLEAALQDGDLQKTSATGSPKKFADERTTLVAGENGFIQFSVHLLEEKFITREAMKSPPSKSVLDSGDLNASQTTEVANEMLNERQRANGGDVVTEDASRYQVTVHIPDTPTSADWSGEVTGSPQLFSLKTVNVVAAGKTIVVLDRLNKKIWEATFTYNLPAGGESPFGAGPCVEYGGTLYVFDQAVLSAFDLTTGNARWRLPSVGVVGLFFDGENNLYVNTTTGNPDDLKYSRQIDIAKATDDVLLKIDPAAGKILWRSKPGGFISYMSGKFIYTVESYDPNPTDEEILNDSMSGLEKPPYLRIARISPQDGRVLWDHEQDRCPVAVRFNENSIELVFKREVQVLRYLSF